MADATQAPANAAGPTSHTQNPSAGLLKLREPFPKEQIQGLPKVTCRACTNSPSKNCDRHKKKDCEGCGNWITEAHVDLNYVGHADLTNRLLEADLLWDWEPMAIGPDGLPAFDKNGGLWIRLTVCGHTRLGYGDAGGKSGNNAVKEAIGDALRNAAMRFGAALDLWSKSDLRAAQAEHPKDASHDISPEQRLEQLVGWSRTHWGSLARLRDIRTWVGAENFRESQIPAAGGELREFGDVLDERIRDLVEREKNPQPRPTETPKTPDTSDAVPAAPDRAQEEQRSEADAVADLDRLMKQVADHWNHRDVLTQVRAEAGHKGLLDRNVEGPPPERAWMAFSELLDRRLEQLNAGPTRIGQQTRTTTTTYTEQGAA